MTLKRKLTSEEKAQIISLHQQGLTTAEIADAMHIDNAQQIVGIIRAAVNFKKIPSMAPPPRQPGVPIMMTLPPSQPPPDPVPQAQPPQLEAAVQMGSAAPAPAAPPVSRPVHVPQAHQSQQPHPEFRALPPAGAPAAPAGDGFGAGWAPVQGYAGGFNYKADARTYRVYRDEPTNDGLLGEHVDPFGETDIAKTYGGGVYRVQRFDPGNPRPFQTVVRVSSNYGAPRFGNRQQQVATPERPGYGRYQGGGRSWLRSQDPREEGGVEEPRPYYERPRSAYDFARHEPSPDVGSAAIKAFSDLALKQIDQNEQTRRQGPDSFMGKFYTEQQSLLRDQMAEQNRQDEKRRREEEEKWDRQRKEASDEHQRRQVDEEKRHARELERLKLESQSREAAAKEERKSLMDLEDKKLAIIRDEHKMRQEALEAELKRNREEQRTQQEKIEKQLAAMQEATAAEIEETRERFNAQMERDRKALDREHELKAKAQEREHELNTKILDVKAEAMEAAGTNEIVGVVSNLVNKFAGAFKEMIDLKKIEASANLSPEAQAASVVHSMGDRKPEPEPEQVAPASPAAAAAAGAAAAGSAGKNGNGHAAQEQKERPMEDIIQEKMGEPIAQKLIKEWALHVQTGQDGTAFVNMYMQWMNDPFDHDTRKATSVFASFIAPRNWAMVYAIIKPKLSPEVAKILDTQDAAEFYETFRGLVTEYISAYHEGMAQEREALKAARRAAAKGVPVEEASRK